VDTSEINILMIITGAMLIFTIILNLPWIEVYTVSSVNPLFRLELTPYNFNLVTAGETISTPELELLNDIYMFYLLILGGLAVAGGASYNTDLGYLVYRTVKNKIVYVVSIFTGLLLVAFLYTLSIGLVTFSSIEFMGLIVDVKIAGSFIGVQQGEILVPLKLEIGPGLVTSIVASILSALSSRIKRKYDVD